MNIRLYEEKDSSPVVSLMNRIWQLSLSEANHLFTIKYYDNPFHNSPLIAVLEDENGKICGIRPLFYLPFQKNEAAEVLHVFQPADAFLNINFRKQGYLQKMLEVLRVEIERLYGSNYLLLSMSANESAQKSHKRFGFRQYKDTIIWGKNQNKGLVWKVLPLPKINFDCFRHQSNGLIYEGSSKVNNCIRKETTKPNWYFGPIDDHRFLTWRNRFAAYPMRGISVKTKDGHIIASCILREYRGNEFHVQYTAYESIEVFTKMLGYFGSKFPVGRLRIETLEKSASMSNSLMEEGFKVIGSSNILLKEHSGNPEKWEVHLHPIFADRFF